MKRPTKNNSNSNSFASHASKRKSYHTRTTQSTVRRPSHQPLYQDTGLACAAAGLQSLQFNQSTSPPTSTLETRSPRMAAPPPSPLGSIPTLYTAWPPILDELETESSDVQHETVEECLPHLSASSHIRLTRDVHVRFLHRCLRTLPATFVAYDPARPWLIYWVLTALSILGEDIEQYRERVTQTLSAAHNATGGFGGGHGQISHCAPSYAAILSLAMIGGTESLELIDRKALWHWLGQVKQTDGGFRVCLDGEQDVRGAYCSMVMIALLKLPLSLPPDAPARQAGLELFTDGLPEYLSRCQTYEGGVSSSPQTEAHGAYAFCALACLSILGPPHDIIPRYLDVAMLMSWLSARQHAPEGGFAGRTNKLVDGCYSFWVGGCWPFLQAAASEIQAGPEGARLSNVSLYSHEGLTRYILACCQSEEGGLRDKPSKYPDAYHSCYVLAGLSSAQHRTWYEKEDGLGSIPALTDAFRWISSPRPVETGSQAEPEMAKSEGALVPIHPIFAIPWPAVETTASWFDKQGKF
ncbi:MAG: hypothetical protein Q9228_004393 [Teloschistes exilis]